MLSLARQKMEYITTKNSCLIFNIYIQVPGCNWSMGSAVPAHHTASQRSVAGPSGESAPTRGEKLNIYNHYCSKTIKNSKNSFAVF